MMLTVTWIPDGQTKGSTLTPLPGFTAGKPGHPDLTFLYSSGTMGLVVRNGLVHKEDRAKQYGTMRGWLVVMFAGAKVIDEYLVIPDGTGVAYSQPGPLSNPPGAVVDWLLRDCKDLSKPLLKSFIPYFFDCNPYYKGKSGYDEPEPDQAGSPRLTEYAPVLALGAAFLVRHYSFAPSTYRLAAMDWTRLQYRRPYGYYDEQGEPWRFSAEADSWADEKGWRKSGKAVIDRPSECLYQAADPEHLALDREWADAVLWNDPLAWLLLDHQGEAICSWPMCREPVVHGNLRAYARTIKALALLVGAWGDKRPQFQHALATAYTGLMASCGVSDEGIPYANPSPPKAVSETYSHVCATAADVALHPEWPLAETQERFRAVIVPWVGCAIRALRIVKDIPAAAACCLDLDDTLANLYACVSQGRLEGIDNDGQPAIPAPCQDSYAWRVPGRVKRANLPWKGTMDWLAPALDSDELMLMPDAKVGTLSAVECFWDRLGG